MPDIEVFRGDEESPIIHITQNNQYVDVSTETVTATFKALANDTAALFTLSSNYPTTGDGSITKTDPSHGQISLDFKAELTEALYAPTALLFDIQLESGGGAKRTVLVGTCLVKKEYSA